MSHIVIDYASDLNLDTWFDLDNLSSTDELVDFWRSLNPKGQALIISGNISRYYQLTFEFLNTLKDNFYEDIFIVLGNIDYYSPEKINNEDIGSFDRMMIQERFCRDNDIYYLQGDVIDYYGLTIGGFNSWYDTSVLSSIYSENERFNIWANAYVDAQFIDGYTHYKDIWRQELSKLRSLLEEIKDRQEPLDIMVTHFCPLYSNLTYPPEKEKTSELMFHYFNGQSLINPKYIRNWIYGSTGYTTDFDLNGIHFMSNHIGNKRMHRYPKLKQFIF